MSEILDTVQQGWTLVAGVQQGFTPGAWSVRVVQHSGLAPEGWCGIVRLGDSLLATAPNEAAAATLRAACGKLGAIDETAIPRLAESFQEHECLGPAALLFGDAIPASPHGSVAEFDVHSTEMQDLVRASSIEDVAEAGVAELRSVFAVVRAGRIVSAAGYSEWLGRLAHIPIMTHPDERRRGYARTAASATMHHAIGRGLTIQWRARPEPSRQLALSLGLVELGNQLSVRL